jgi:hypothetical protein
MALHVLVVLPAKRILCLLNYYCLGSYVVSPYNDYPQLLGLLLRMLNGELAWSTRSTVLKVSTSFYIEGVRYFAIFWFDFENKRKWHQRRQIEY